MTESKSEAAIAAATVVLMRDTGGVPELLLVERAAATAFAGGAMVFPGGRVDPGDHAVAADAALAIGTAGLDPTDAAARVAAARESFEEADVVLSDGPPLDANDRAAWRAQLNADTLSYGDFLRAAGHRIDTARLTPFTRWVPPAAAKLARRFDTLFYIAELPPGETVTPDGREAVAAHWLTAGDAVARAQRSEISLLFPTRRNLERLAQYPSLASLLARLTKLPITLIQPEIVMRDGAPWLTIPTDCDYPITEEPIGAVRRE